MAPQRVPPPGTHTYSSSDNYYRGTALTANESNANGGFVSTAPASGVQPANYQEMVPRENPANSPQSVRAAIESAPTPQRMQLKGMPAVDLTASYSAEGVQISGPSASGASLASSVPSTTAALPASTNAFGPPNMARGQFTENAAPPLARLPQAGFAPITRPAANVSANSPQSSDIFGAPAVKPATTKTNKEVASPEPAITSPEKSAEAKPLPWQTPRS